ncbi:hypothetical protein TNCV_3857121 [Trichonephila clavipes]|nr:hypothetical protein TNCV_3857121 [Trichonephila clavipes]
MHPMHLKVLSQYLLTCGLGNPDLFYYLRYCLEPFITKRRRNLFGVLSGAGSLRISKASVFFYTFSALSETSMALNNLRSR